MAKKHPGKAAPKAATQVASVAEPAKQEPTGTELGGPVASDAPVDAVAGDPPPNPDVAVIGPASSSGWPDVIDIEGEAVPQEVIARAAFQRWGVTLDEWNGSPEGRAREIADEVQRRRAAAAAEKAKAEAPQRPVDFEFLSTADRNNPEKLHGQHLREFGYRQGLSWSEMGRCSDDKIREQLRYIAYNRYER